MRPHFLRIVQRMTGLVLATLVALAPAKAPETSAFVIPVANSERHVRYLASPELKGRMTLSPHIGMTTDYIVSEFKRLGLKPAGTNGFLHAFETQTNQRPGKMNAASLMSGDQEWSLELGKDWVPLVGSRHQTLFTGDVVFVGSQTAEQAGDVAGKWVLMYRTNPTGNRQLSAANRATEFARKGARGVIFAGPIAEGRLELPMYARPQGISQQAGILGVAITRQVFEKSTGLKWGTEPGQGQARELRFRAITDLEANRGTAQNVIAMLPGNDPKLKDEVIVIGAHHDHLGYGEVGSRTGNDILHLGADDNASGVAGVLALAEWFSQNRVNRRTIIFQSYCAEEIGLVGARAWVRDNPEKVKTIQMMVNMDMIGRLRNEALTVFCADSAPQFAPFLDAIKVPGVTINKVMSSPGNSDHAPFIASRVPSLFFHTGLTPEYHTENDTVDTINWDGMARVIEVVRQMVLKVDAVDSRLEFSARPATRPAGGDPAPARRARVGFIPDMGAQDFRGLPLTGVVPDSPAERAGVRAGDVLVSFNGRQIRSVEDLQEALSAARPGVAVKIVVLRGDQRLELDLTPAAPPN